MASSLPRSATGKTALTVARRCAKAAAPIIMGGYEGGKPPGVRFKGRRNVVTRADLEAERAIKEILALEYPQHAILSEETASTTASEGWLWVVDPLDGTRNYVSGIPFFCVNIALCHADEPQLALTYDPVRREEFVARKGRGAFKDGRPMRASAQDDVLTSVMAFDLGYDDQRARRMLELAISLWPGMQGLRIPGSSALGLAYAACGRFDLFVHYYLFPWDVAPGILLVEEAGGTITDRDGNPITIHSETAVAGGQRVHADFMRLARNLP